MNAALWLLLWLRLKGWSRRLGRNLRTTKGAFLVLVTLGVFLPWLLAGLFAPRPLRDADLDTLRRFGPLWLLAYVTVTLALSSGERALAFSPAEGTLLFSGPFGRRQLVLYKVVANAGNAFLAGLFLSVLLGRYARHPLAAYAGVVLALVFLQLFSMALALGLAWLGERVPGRPLRLLVLSLAVCLLAALSLPGDVGGGFSFPGWLERLEQTPAVRAILSPLRWFLEAFAAERLWPDLALWGGLGLATDLSLLALVFALDRHYLETAAAVSERFYARLQQARGGTLPGPRVGTGPVRWGLPGLPWWGGAGPVVWRQLTTAMRSLDRLGPLVFVYAVLLLPLLSGDFRRGASPLAPVLGGMVVGLSVVLTPLVPFDFRGDLDRLAELKALPLSSIYLAAGQLVTPVLLVSLFQGSALLAIQAARWRFEAGLGVMAAFAVPFNLLLFAVENLLFLWFPMRLFAPPGDLQALGRHLLRWLAQLFTVTAGATLAGTFGVATYYLTGRSSAAGLAAAWLTLAGSALALVPLVALAFRRFDVARDVPP